MSPRPMDRPTDGAAPVEKVPRWLIGLFLFVVVAAGFGFIFKIVEFGHSIRDKPDVSFALMPVCTYIVVAAGFFALLAWSLFSGHLRDIEGPKHFMLANERELDAATPPPRRDR